MKNKYDAVVIGSGPNGLAAAVTIAKAGYSVKIFEAKKTIGGGMRTSELLRPGFFYDICSAIHPMAAASPFLNKLPLKEHGLKWIYPPVSLAHPFDDGSAVLLKNSVEETSQTLGIDSENYKKLMNPLLKNWNKIFKDLLGPLSIPSHPIPFTKFGIKALQSAIGFSNRKFNGKYAKGLFAGLAAHSILPLNEIFTSAIGLVLGIVGHASGWPLPEGGSQKIADSLASYFLSLGGEIETDFEVKSLNDLPKSEIILFDITPRQILKICGDKFSSSYKYQLEKYKYGSAVFKVDWILENPIPFKAKECSLAGTVHIGGTIEEIRESEYLVSKGKHSEKPYIILAQQSLFDKTRSPEGKHVGWAYCHVPNNSNFDMTERIENQIERFAPGFKDSIIDKQTTSAPDFEKYNSNYVGGDINGGMQNWRQLFTRPVISLSPYSTSLKGTYICSSSTPPGGGVHGMCGYHAAKKSLKDVFKKEINFL